MCSGASTLTIVDSILWDDFARDLGPELYLENSATVDISYSDVMGGQASAHIDGTSALLWGAGMIDADPLLVASRRGDLHLEQDPPEPGVFNPCVDAGDPGSAMIEGTTRTDLVQDAGILDLGYHFE